MSLEELSPSDLAVIIDRACAGASSYVEIGGRLSDFARSHDGDGAPNSALAPFVIAFSYDLAERNTERRGEYGAFVPMWETSTHAFPPRLDAVDAGHATAWARVHSLVREPAARARLGDLVWTKKAAEQPHLFARDAVVAYRDVAATWSDLDAGDALMRSLELALQMNDTEQARASAERIVDAAAHAMAESSEKPGVSLRLIEALVEMPSAPSEVDGLLEQAIVCYQNNIHVSDSIADMRSSRASGDPERVAQIRTEQAQGWLEFAARCEPMVAMHHLQHGLELAKTYGLTAEQTQFRLALQRLDRESMGFERIQAEAAIDGDALEQLVESMVDASWPESLRAFGATGPPTGDAAENEAIVRQVMREHPIAFLFNRVELGPENTITANAVTEEDKFVAELVAHEQRGIILWGHLGVETLRRITERHGAPSQSELTTYFTRGAITPELAESFARAVGAYVDGRYDESSLILAVRIEALIRELARLSGLVVTREPDGARAGGVRSLGIVLTSLRPYFPDQSWWRYLWTALAEPRGLNLRNRLAHGVMPGSNVSAAVLIHVVCFLALLGPAGPSAESGDS